MIRDVFYLVCLGDMISGQAIRSLELYHLFFFFFFFFPGKIVTGEYHKAMGYMKNSSLVVANPDRANIFFINSYKGPHM